MESLNKLETYETFVLLQNKTKIPVSKVYIPDEKLKKKTEEFTTRMVL